MPYEFSHSNIKILYYDDILALGSYATAKIFSVPRELVELVKTCLNDQAKFTLEELAAVVKDEGIVRMFVFNKIITKAITN